MPSENLTLKINAKDQTKGALGGITKRIIGIGAAFLGLRAGVNVLKDIVKVGQENEKVWTSVAGSLKRHNIAVEEGIDAIGKFADEMQTLTGISDEVIAQGVKQFIDYGATIEEATKTMQVAADLAAGQGLNMKAAVDLLAKAQVGYTGTLSRYGIIIDENIPKTEKFAAAIQQINDRFGGASKDIAETFAVRMALAKEKFGDFQENVFKKFLPIFESVVNFVIELVDTLSNKLFGLEMPTDEADDFATSIQGIATELQVVTALMGPWVTVTVEGIKIIKNGIELTIGTIKSLASVFVDTIIATSLAIGGDLTAAVRLLQKSSSEAAVAMILDFIELTNAVDKYNAALDEIDEQSDNIRQGIIDANAAGKDAIVETTEAVTEALQDQVIVFSDTKSQLVEITDEWKENELGAFATVTAEFKAAEAAKISIAQSTARALQAATFGAVNRIVDSLGFLETNSRSIFKNMAADFAKFFIQDALRQLALKFVGSFAGGGILSILGSIFDTAANDRMAMQQGRDYANFFTRGALDTINQFVPTFANIVTGGIAPSLSTGHPSPAGARTIHLNFNGPVTSREFVRGVIVPEIEATSIDGISSIVVDRDNLTGGPEIVFA